MTRSRDRFAAALGALAAALIVLAGCSNDTPMPSENGPTDASSTSAPAATTVTSSPGLPGLTDDCTQAIGAQVAISTLFAGAVNGTPLTADQVTKAFHPLKVPTSLTDDVEVLRQAATSSVGKSAAQVADTLNSAKVTAAMTALSDYVKNCTPATS